MTELIRFIFLTLVLTLVVGILDCTNAHMIITKGQVFQTAFAAPSTELKPATSTKNLEEELETDTSKKILKETIQSTPTSPNVLTSQEGLEQSKSNRKSLKGAPALSAQIGFLGGSPEEAKQNLNTYIMGLEILNPDRKTTPWSLGFKFNSNLNLFLLSLEKSDTIDWPDFYQPYWRYGFGFALNSDEGLATFLNTRRIHAKLGFGFNDFLETEKKNSLELGLGLGMTGVFYYLQFAHYFYF